MLVLVVFLLWAALLRSFWGLLRGKKIAETLRNTEWEENIRDDSLENKKSSNKSEHKRTDFAAAGGSKSDVRSDDVIGSSFSATKPISIPSASPNGDKMSVPSSEPYHISNDKFFLLSPVAKKLGTMQCKITRTPDKLMFFLELEQCTGDTRCRHATPVFLLKGKKPLVGFNVYLSNNEHDQASSVAMRASHGYMGKLLCSKDLNEFSLLDNGSKTKSKRSPATSSQGPVRRRHSASSKVLTRSFSDHSGGVTPAPLRQRRHSLSPSQLHQLVPEAPRQELLHIKMTRAKIGECRNREMEVLCPRVDPDDPVPVCYQESAPAGVFSALSQWPSKSVTRLRNKKAEWDQDHPVLNFHGRVTQPSIKNFQLEDQAAAANSDSKVVLQCGRTGRHTFIVDFSWPLSPVQAFAIALCKLTAQ